MKKLTCHYKLTKYLYYKYSFLSLFVMLLFSRGFFALEETGDNFFHIVIDGVEIGTTDNEDHARDLVTIARQNIARESRDITFIEADVDIWGEEVLWGEIDGDEDIIAAAERALKADIIETMQRGYSVRVNDFMVNLASIEEVRELFQAAVDKYAADSGFHVELISNENHEFHVLTAKVMDGRKSQVNAFDNMTGGVEKYIEDFYENQREEDKMDFSDFELGIRDIGFAEEIEVAETYLPAEKLNHLETAIGELIKEEEKPGEYEVVAGDTLIGISIKVGIPLEEIVSMNSDALEDINTTIDIGQKLIITVPEPTLSVERVEERYYEEIYDADIIYIDKDDWYTYQTNVVQQPSAGFRKVVANVSFVNEKEISREILKEEIVMEAIPRIVERGTKIPPTYIKPISGGVISSGYGYRDISLPGATSNHEAIDWAVPLGTSVYASCGGTVVRAGWGSGYGYVVYINHEDGRQTRYAHLSKILVSVGQTVSQGEKIALSGSTGASTGPHVHFEMLIDGKRVNPLLYGVPR